jgi:NAD(P)-dependent dehydrogenase (short-subunit alcohol dehydrogenase family)
MKLRNKTIAITGVSSGIGAEVARLARFKGARVIGIDRNDPTLSLDTQKGENKKMCACVSRIVGGGVVIDTAYRGSLSRPIADH